MKTKNTPSVSRRTCLGQGALGSGLLLRSLATGLPVSWLLNPERAMAQQNMQRPQTLIFSTSSAGDPVNINCPGSYVQGVTNNPHLGAQQGRFGDQRVRAAAPG